SQPAPDLLELSTGERIQGRILNPDILLRTSYGELRLKSGCLAGIQPLQDDHGLQTVSTVNSNIITGFVESSVLEVARPDATSVEVAIAELSKAVFGPRDSPVVKTGSRWVRLRAGDVLSGRFLGQPIRFVEKGKSLDLNLNAIDSTTFEDNSPGVTGGTEGGVGPLGRTAPQVFEFQLDVGPTVKLYRSMIAWIGSAEKLNTSTPAAVSGSVVGAEASSNNLAGFAWIPAGQFRMGSPTEETGRDPDEGPQTQVTIPKGFWMSRCEVTQAEYQRVMGINPSNATGDANRPVERVSWFDAVEYCKRLTDEAERTGRLPENYVYRLPTEAEWEYACRAGTSTRFSFGEDKNGTQLVDYAWFTRNSDSVTHPVGTRKPNPWGLYDMHGNVWEWCLDRWDDVLPGGTVTNRITRASGSLRVARGGSWLYEPKACRSANRDDYSPFNRCSDVGFRVVLGAIQ
ncbi:MAG TPA: formylglycine-generating enzyme family protein, partial [Verrucomicrobiae bacterium]|nr:formylglycine-generating enzyme family protein [Verrucomicrobiae bacterium]